MSLAFFFLKVYCFVRTQNALVNDFSMGGFIYILEHSSGTTVKVGETSVSPERRAADYSREHQLNNFKLAKVFEVPEEARKDIERRAHQNLRQYKLSGVSNAREIFSCSLSVAVGAVEAAISSSEQFKHWQETEGQRKAQEQAIGMADKERDDSIRKLEEEARNSCDKDADQRRNERENLLQDHKKKKKLFLIGSFLLATWGYTAPAGGPLIGLLVGAALLWWIFRWSKKITEHVDEVLDHKYPIRELFEYPSYLFQKNKIETSYEERIRKINNSFSVNKKSKQSSISSIRNNVATQSSGVVTKREFTCPTCSRNSNIPLGKTGRVTCPGCQTRTLVDASGNVKDEATHREKLERSNLSLGPKATDQVADNEVSSQPKTFAGFATERHPKAKKIVFPTSVTTKKSFDKDINNHGFSSENKPATKKKIDLETNEKQRPEGNRAARRKKLQIQNKIDNCEQLIERLRQAALNGHYSSDFLHLEKILHQTPEIKSSCSNCNSVRNHYYNLGGKSLRCGLCGHERVF